ncbi:sOS mutagenesis and repair protein UmuD [Salmonella enterica]|nr:sOS mutagenesis and repair protein UmuD [Salmonella enterica]EDL1834442.1 sOS mutagenesis and repair protein UmuD [Salmonella enterica subsp. enterica serovar Montevideo]EBE5400755.1 sOS mutagenesis and repair protein UmuD [Salmonella enterica]EBE9419213.1 sOS mutagenesis and repair protein UmuD [Salmonella enterica]EBN1326359.1 sOS mutagenesis and repair protein UmuD [Salmonella enterica]
MGFASPAADYTETRLSLDNLCKTHAPGVFIIRSETHSVREGIKPGALLIVDYGAQPVDGSLVLCVMENVFRIKRLRLYPAAQLQDLDRPGRSHVLPRNDEDGIEIRGVVTHIVNDARTGEFDNLPVI